MNYKRRPLVLWLITLLGVVRTWKYSMVVLKQSFAGKAQN